MAAEITIRPMQEADVPAARRIFSLAFGTFIGVPDPASFGADRDYIGTRRTTRPEAAFVAELDGEVVASNLAVRWGSVGFFGPLTVRPDLWDRGIGKLLMEPVVDCFDRWQVSLAGLHTFAQSPRHLGLYQKFGFWPRFLTAIMSAPAEGGNPGDAETFSGLDKAGRHSALDDCNTLTEAVYPGLRLDREIRSLHAQSLGDTVLIRDGDDLVGLAVCHCGTVTEAGADNCYVKFGAVRPGPGADTRFTRLLGACRSLSASRGLSQVNAGVNLAREPAFRAMQSQGFRAEMYGIAMHRPNVAGYSHKDAWVLDDWR